MAEKSEIALRSYFQQGDIWEQEVVKRAKRSARVAWFFSIIFAGVAVLSLLAIGCPRDLAAMPVGSGAR